MIYEKELRFLCKVFEKSHIGASSVSIDELIYGRLPSPTNESFFGDFPTLGDTARAFMQRTVYKFKNKLGLSFICLLLPETDNALLVGPYHTASPTPLLLLELGEKNGVSPKRQKYFEEYRKYLIDNNLETEIGRLVFLKKGMAVEQLDSMQNYKRPYLRELIEIAREK